MAHKCVNDFQRCEICGLPQWFNRAVLNRYSFFMRGNERVHRRLVPDHIHPGNGNDLSNIRILCYTCNDLRGPALRSDTQILRQVRRWYRRNFPLSSLWWLNVSPGEGGTLFRNRFMERKAIKLLAPHGLQTLENLHIKIGKITPVIVGAGNSERMDNGS